VRRRVRLLAAAVAGLTGLVLAACDALPGRPDAAKREVVPTEVTAFDALYGRNCAGCHGAEGRLGAARPLNDPVYLALVPADRLRAIIRGGVPGTSMPAFGTAAGGELTDAQVEALAQGLLARWGRPDVVKGVTLPPYGMPPDASGTAGRERGAAVYARACAGCHGPDGRGGPKAGPIVDPTYLALVSDQSLRSTVIAGRADLGHPDWRGDVPGHPLTPEEITDVVSWLAAHRQPVPGRPAPGGGPRGPRP
jgi:cytochrome c oxidase cbb3-type subunit 3